MNRNAKRTNRTIVAAISLVIVVIAVVAWVDEYRDLRQAARDASQLRRDWSSTADENRKLEQIQTKIANELSDFQKRATDPTEIETVRDELIEIVRQSGSRLRQVEITNRSQRNWALEGDDPRKPSIDRDVDTSKYRLHSYTMEFRAEGSFETIRTLMDQIANQPWMMTTNRFTLAPVSGDRQSVAIDMTLTFYGLEERQINEDELAAL